MCLHISESHKEICHDNWIVIKLLHKGRQQLPWQHGQIITVAIWIYYCKTKITIPPEEIVIFAWRITNKFNTDCNNDKWHKNATYRKCGNRGHIIPNWPRIKSNNGDDYDSTKKENSKSHNKYILLKKT